MGQVGTMLGPVLKLSLSFAEMVLKDVKSDDFARLPRGIRTNHPAFVFGHLSIYPERVLTALGKEALARPDTRYDDLFAPGKDCVDDPTATIYPSMADLLERFRSRHAVLLSAITEAGDDVFARPNPNPKSIDRFPTVGALTAFLVSGHMMVHLGQVSAWRRIMGLGPAVA